MQRENSHARRIEEFIKSQRLAVVGVSKRKFGGTIYKALKKRGYEVYPVHPTMETFDGDRCYSTLAQLPKKIDAAIIAVSPANAAVVLKDIRETGITKLWFQQGADFSNVIAKIDSDSLQIISGKCILMYAPPVTGIHSVHRFFARLFGSL